jgi:hypothetical protein
LSQKGITAINGISDKLSKIDANKLAEKVSGWVAKATPYWEQFKNVLTIVGGVIKKVGTFLLEHSNVISKAIPIVLAAVAAYKGFQIVNGVVGAVKSFSNSILGLAGKAGSSVAENLEKTAAGQSKVGKTSMTTGTQMLQSAKAFMMLGAGVLMVAAGFGILAYSAIQLAAAGGPAIAVMAGLVIALAAMGAGMAFLLKTLAPFGAQMVPAGVAMLAMGAARTIPHSCRSLATTSTIMILWFRGLLRSCFRLRARWNGRALTALSLIRFSLRRLITHA